MLLPYVLFVFLYVGSYLLILEFESWITGVCSTYVVYVCDFAYYFFGLEPAIALMTKMLLWGPVDVWLRGVHYMGGTRGSCVLSSAGDVLEISVVRGVARVCDMCKCLARGVVGGVGVSE